MSLFQIKWLRRFIRKNTTPINKPVAQIWKQRLAIGYAILAWNAFGFVCYNIYNGRADWAKHHGLKTEEELKLSPAQQFSKILNVDKGKIIRYSGFTRVGETTFDNTERNSEEVITDKKV